MSQAIQLTEKNNKNTELQFPEIQKYKLQEYRNTNNKSIEIQVTEIQKYK